jgi:uncharacterized protein (DUF1800 family)
MPVTAADAAHLLRRTGFGVTPARLRQIKRLRDRDAAVDEVTDVSLTLPVLSAPTGGRWVEDQWEGWRRLTWWWLDRMRKTRVPLVEKMTLFWHGHFATSQAKVHDIGLLYRQNRLFRRHALGDYHDLVQRVAVDPAMLRYLDNGENVAGQEQDNFAREVMELFTLGQGHYTEDDVTAMARAWTGHNLSKDRRRYEFRREAHDDGEKVLFGLPPRRWDGPDALTEILRGSLAVPASQHLTAKLFSFLAYPIAPTDPLVASLAARFRAEDLSILALVRAILRSDAFWSPTARYALVRSPVEWFVAGLQALDLDVGDTHPEWFMEAAGQLLFYPPDVAGWKQNEHWISTASSWAKSGWASHARWKASDAGVFAGITSRSPRTTVSEAFRRFGIVEPSPTTRAALEAWVARAKAEGDSWSIAPNLVHLMLLSPDFQVA